MKSFDVIIPLGSGSIWNNTELRYALRSVDKYVNTMGNVYLIGECPTWVKNVYHIKAADRPGQEWKEFNIMQKILKACTLPALSREFIFMNDDHFLLAPVPPLPSYYQDTLNAAIVKRKVQDSYYHSLNNTRLALENRGYQTLNFDIHAPILYDKNLFTDAVLSYDWNAVPYGYVIKSLYCNTLGAGGVTATDLKVKERWNCFELEALTLNRSHFSMSDEAICPDLETFLRYLYPTKSKYEL